MKFIKSIKSNLASILIICIITILLAGSIASLTAGKPIEALNFSYILVGSAVFFIILLIGIYLKGKNYRMKGRPLEFAFFVSLFIASSALTYSVVFLTISNGAANFVTSIFWMMIFYGLSLGFGVLHYLLELDGK